MLHVDHYCTELIEQKLIAFSPLSLTHRLAITYGFDGEWEFWRDYDLAFLECAKELHVLCLPGWEQSRGVQEEIEFATARNIPILYKEI